MRTALWVGAAGFFGSMLRYLVAGSVSRVDETFPWGTFVVNITGSFALGVLVAAMSHRFVAHPDLRVAITVGFLGAYTTFSTFALETFEFAETGTPYLGALNVLGSVVFGVAAVWAGAMIGRSL